MSVVLVLGLVGLGLLLAALLLRWLLRPSANSATVFHHHFSPANRLRHLCDTLPVALLHRSLFVSSSQEARRKFTVVSSSHPRSLFHRC
jgi:hypothetical protein